MTASSPVLVEPAFRTGPDYHTTLGPEVADLSSMVWSDPDPEQRLALDMLFGVDKAGQAAAFEFGIVCARQNLKTGLLKQAALGWLFLTDQQLIIWSAHEFPTAAEAHRDLRQIIDGSYFLSRRVRQIYDSSANKSIELMSGARILFKARTHTGGVGLSGWKVILDEAFALVPDHLAAIGPTLSAMPDPQLVYASSAGHAASEALRSVRDRGRVGAERLAYLEWCAKRGGCEKDACDHAVGTFGCALDRVENWRAANPLLGRQRQNGTGLTEEYIRSERNGLLKTRPDKFARERLGWWDEPGADEVFGAGKYAACGGETPEGVALEAVAVAVSIDLKHAAIIGVGTAGERVYAQVLQHGPGYDWVPDALPVDLPVVVDLNGPSAVLMDDLQGFDLVEVTAVEVLDAFDTVMELVVDGVLLHDRDPLLETAVNGAVPQNVQDRRKWGRRKSTSDITAIEAVTLGAWFVTLPVEAEPLPPTPPAVVRVTAARNDLATIGF